MSLTEAARARGFVIFGAPTYPARLPREIEHRRRRGEGAMNDNTSIARAVCAAFRRGDISAVCAMPAPDVHRAGVEGGLHPRPLQGG
jgi:hypothetical protein